MKTITFIKAGGIRLVWATAVSLACLLNLDRIEAQPITNNAVVVALDVDGDSEADLNYREGGAILRTEPYLYYGSGMVLLNTPQLRFVRASKQRIDFGPSLAVSASSAVYVSAGEDNYVSLLAYDAEYMFGEWRYYPPQPFSPDLFYTNKTEVFIGFRLTGLEAGTKHHGWLRFTRPDTNVNTRFDLDGYDWNPLPNEPIGAGQPPVIPVQSAFTDEGQLRLQWPAEVANWVLESSPTLGPDAVWEPVPDVVGTEHLIEAPEADRFYRLRRP